MARSRRRMFHRAAPVQRAAREAPGRLPSRQEPRPDAEAGTHLTTARPGGIAAAAGTRAAAEQSAAGVARSIAHVRYDHPEQAHHLS